MWCKVAFLICICALASFKLDAASVGEPSLESNPFLRNGKKAAPGQFPYLAHISSVNRTSGARRVDSATLVSDHHLLSKAIFIIDWEDVDVILGAERPMVIEPNQQRFVARYDDIIFPETIESGYDLAIILLPQRVRFTDFVQPALLPRWSDKGRSYDESEAIVSGWIDEFIFQVAGYDNVEISNYLDCGPTQQPDTLCVSDAVMSGGDNGSPLILETADGPEVIGIFSLYSSFQKEGAEFIQTNVFIKLNEQLEFIANNTGISIRP